MSVFGSKETQCGLTGKVEAYARDEEKSSALSEDVVSALRDRDDEGGPEDGDGQRVEQ
ncbi:hypothetical protein [Methylobacterium isbiliense]|jgi:hypothetical protein|uniref:hypothetical protein n=1 Tax=Methylobacterium isbiliense TaxID=315478 RepID=UPI001EE2DE8D|nr:hypothetical protein [Methylobacterium isbiliense]MDN3625698.1 hypothetical protein [Methylobacterium isbiliense]